MKCKIIWTRPEDGGHRGKARTALPEMQRLNQNRPIARAM